MKRIPEREVMDDPAQVEAYARADFSGVNQGFVDRLLRTFPDLNSGRILDLGCGPADIPIRIARAAPGIGVTAVDASGEMLLEAETAVREAGLHGRIALVQARLPDLPFPARGFDGIISNSLVHQLPRPGEFWASVKRLGRPGAAVFVMDLFRPASKEKARAIVETAAAGEHPILKEDFFNSLLAAFNPEEVQGQLRAAGLSFHAEIVSDRHWLVSGRLP